MKKIILAIIVFISSQSTYSQTIEELFAAQDYQGLTWLEGRVDKASLSGEQAYMLASAFFQMENDEKTVEYCDQAIKKGYDQTSMHLYKAVSLRSMEKFDNALIEIGQIIKAKPNNPLYVNEKGLIFLGQKQFDKAIEVFEQAKSLSSTYTDPYYWVAYTLAEKKAYKEALSAYYTAKEKISDDSRFKLLALTNIGELEYSHTKNYPNSIKAYTEALEISGKNHEVYFGLVKSYNTTKDTLRADSIFSLIKMGFDNLELPKKEMKAQNIVVHEFDCDGKNVVLRRMLSDVKTKQDVMYKIFLMNTEGKAIERKFEIVQTSEAGNPAKYQLFEEDPSGRNMPLANIWTSAKVSTASIENAIRSICEVGKKKATSKSKK